MVKPKALLANKSYLRKRTDRNTFNHIFKGHMLNGDNNDMGKMSVVSETESTIIIR